MKKVILFITFLFATLITYAQDAGKYIIEYKQNPLTFIEKNKYKYFSKEEFNKLKKHGSIGLDVCIEYETKKIISVRYSPTSKAYNELGGKFTLEDSLSYKLSDIIIENIQVQKIILVPKRENAPNEVNFILTLDFK